MGGATVDPKALEDAMLKALPSLFPNHLGTASGARVEFYDKFKREADEYDRDFMKKYEEDLNTTLIFAGLFSAVTSAFIVDVQQNLQPDYTKMSFALLQIIASTSLGNTPTGDAAKIPKWDGPDPTIIHVQAILYSSLAASLLSALVAMLGKQWLNRYARTEVRGSVIDRSRHRQRKMDGMVTWHFDLVMECLPLMLQIALLLLGYALSNYLFSMSRAVSGVVIGFTSFGLLFYLLIVSAATLSYNCPFQTPLSRIFHFFVCFDNNHKKYLDRTGKWFRRIFPKTNHQRKGSGGLFGLNRLGTFDAADDHIELPMASAYNEPPQLFDKDIDLDGYVLDSNCIAWMFEKSTDADVIMAIMRFIPEVVWHADIRTTPLQSLYDTVLDCCDQSSGYPVVISKLRNKAYLSAKAFLHLVIQRKCIGDGSDEPAFKSISSRHVMLGSKDYEGDSDLEATLDIIDRIFGNGSPKRMDRQTSTFTVPHHAWMGHILLYRAWDALREGGPLPDDIKDFVLHSLRSELSPPVVVVADCLFIVGLGLGISLHIDDLLIVDKSHEVGLQVNRIYEKLTGTFRDPSSTTDEIDRALESMKLTDHALRLMERIAPLSQVDVAQTGYSLFHVIMGTPVSLAYTQKKKWEASRLALHAAYKWDTSLPCVGDPSHILIFLDHHFELSIDLESSQHQDEPIQDALRALAYASDSDTIDHLDYFDSTKPSFVRGIRYAHRSEKPFELRKAAFFFLSLIGDRWFNAPHAIMRPYRMERLCKDWASAVDTIGDSDDVQKAALTVLFGMINSPHWRPHIVAEKWDLLQHFSSVPDDSLPLKRCIDNPGLVDEIRNVANPDAIIHWLKLLWLKYDELIPEVRIQLEIVTKEVAQGGRRGELDGYVKVMESELETAECALAQYNTWSTDPAAAALRSRIRNLRQAKGALTNVRRG